PSLVHAGHGVAASKLGRSPNRETTEPPPYAQSVLKPRTESRFARGLRDREAIDFPGHTILGELKSEGDFRSVFGGDGALVRSGGRSEVHVVERIGLVVFERGVLAYECAELNKRL